MKKLEKLVEVVYLFSSLFLTGLLLVVLYGSLLYWNEFYPADLAFRFQAFYLAVGITIVTIIAQWIEGRIRAIIESWNNLKGGGEWQDQERIQAMENLQRLRRTKK